MPDQIKDLETGNVYDTPYAFEGGFIQFLPDSPDCPVLVMPPQLMPGTSAEGKDAIKVFQGRTMENRFVKYNEGDPDPDPDPDPTGEPVLIPSGSCNSTAAPKPLPNPEKVRHADGNVVFYIGINNPNNYRVEFSTSFYGAFDSNNNPTVWQELEPINGYYPVRALAVENPNVNLTEVRARWVSCTQQDWGVYVGLAPEGTVNPPTGSSNAIVRAKEIYLSVWGNGGAISRNPAIVGQGTDREEQYMMTNWPQTWPFFIKNDPGVVEVDIWFKNENGQNTTNYEKQNVNVTVSHFVDDAVNAQLNEYAVRSGVQGFNFLWYADDSPLKEHRLAFKRNAKRGLKAFYSIENWGGGYENYGQDNAYTRTVNTIAADMTQSWYTKIDGKPVLGNVIFDSKIDEPAEITKVQTTINRIREVYRSLTGNNSAELYRFMYTDINYDRGSWYFDNDFDAYGPYYILADTSGNNFNNVVVTTNNYMNSRTHQYLAPTIMCGFDNRPREWFYSGGTDPGNSRYTIESTYANFPTLLNNVINAADNNANWPFIMIAPIDEYSESTYCWTPRKLQNGNIDETIVGMMQQRLNPNYTPE